MDTRPERLPAAVRREQMLDAASAVFGERGFAGATTDAIADAAGVSQAYVVRTFGTKTQLFAETANRALDRIISVFQGAAAASGRSAAEDMRERLGRAYVELVADRGILLTVMHLFTLGHHPDFATLAQDGLLRIYRVVRDDAGLGASGAGEFLARGMLINTMLGSRLPDAAAEGSDARELLSCVFNGGTDEVVSALTRQSPLPAAGRSRGA